MKRSAFAIIALANATALLAASLHTASAAPVQPAGKGAPAAAAPATASPKQPTAVPDTLSRYRRVTSAAFTDSANSQVSGSVACPSGTKVISGGAIISSTSVAENLNSSIPTSDGRSWEVSVNNTSGVDGSFVVYAVCLKGVVNYSVVQGGAVIDPPNLNESTQPVVTCPRGTAVLGGGGYTTSSSNQTILAGSTPGSTGRRWYAAFNNRSQATTDDSAYAVCGKRPAGYVVIQGSGADIAPGTQGSASASCPTGKVVLGGGGSPVVFRDGLIDLNSTAAVSSTTWEIWFNNLYSSTISIISAATCATIG